MLNSFSLRSRKQSQTRRSRGRLARTFLRDRDGSVASLFGLMAIVLFLMIGGAVDFGRWLHARHQTINAMDAAVLAAGRSLQVGGDVDAAVAAAQRFYQENTQTRLPLQSDTINFSVGEGGLSVTAGGNAYIETPFLSLAHIDRLAILDQAGADYSKSEVAIGKNSGVNLEISMMLDVTGSMSGSRITDLKVAAKDLVNIVVWDDQSEYTSRVALVPFSEGVRLPNNRTLKKARGNRKGKFKKNGTWYYRSNCVVERTGADAYTDAAPGNNSYVMVKYTPDNSRVCKPSASNKIHPLTNNKNKLRSEINKLQTTGGTAGHIGTAWAWYTLSPNWNSLWDADNQAAAYDAPETKKIAILMTDGSYNTQYASDGTSAWSYYAANGSSTSQARSLCSAMKTAGVTVYTVGFGLSSGSSAAQTMAQCATDPSKSFTAADGDDLRQAFRAIALEISKLYLSS